MFTDQVTLELIAGKGGNGVVSWRREKYIPKGGPFGGNGGRGASIVIEADSQVPSLEAYRNKRIAKADDGGQGATNNKQGKNGRDLVLKVPCGTLIKDKETGEILHDLTENKQRVIMCLGGRGGNGNSYFKSATNQAPNFCTPGRLGQTMRVELELKLIADVGLVGFPNAGKSTLISAITKIRVKIAPYPFTTLRPNLGYLIEENGERLLIADIPGIISGAHKNRGLGLEFLRHIERTSILLFMIDISAIDNRDPIEDFRVLWEEISLYSPALIRKPYAIALNKVDVEGMEENIEAFHQAYPNEKIFEISALSGQGMKEVVDFLKSQLVKSKSVETICGSSNVL